MNVVSLIGRLTKEPELRYTNNGTAVCMFTLAVRNPFNKEQDADFINCVAWTGTAETVANYLKKGMMVGVEGRIHTRNYEKEDGTRVYVTEVNVNSIHFTDSKRDDQQEQEQQNNNNNNNKNSKRNNNSGNGNRNNRQNPR